MSNVSVDAGDGMRQYASHAMVEDERTDRPESKYKWSPWVITKYTRQEVCWSQIGIDPLTAQVRHSCLGEGMKPMGITEKNSLQDTVSSGQVEHGGVPCQAFACSVCDTVYYTISPEQFIARQVALGYPLVGWD